MSLPAPNPNRLNTEWQVFFRRVLPDGASAVQIQEMRRAFFAGAEAAVMRVLIPSFDTGSEEPTAKDELVMIHLAEELTAFGNTVREGKA